MIRIVFAAALLSIAAPALAAERYCYRGGFLCDCETGICEGDNPRNACPAEWLKREHGKTVCDVPGGVALIAQPGAPWREAPTGGPDRDQ